MGWTPILLTIVSLFAYSTKSTMSAAALKNTANKLECNLWLRFSENGVRYLIEITDIRNKHKNIENISHASMYNFVEIKI